MIFGLTAVRLTGQAVGAALTGAAVDGASANNPNVTAIMSALLSSTIRASDGYHPAEV
jgi:hypothetical protein